MVGRCLVFSFAVATILTSSAFGQVQDPREIQARKDCLTGNYAPGVALLAQLFAETGNRNFVYNQARCYEQNARAEDAINRFREYLRVAKGISAEDRADVDRHIAECQVLQAEQARKAALPPAAGPPQVTGGPALESSPLLSPLNRGSSFRIGGAVMGGVGLAALATGGIFSLLVKSTQEQVEEDAGKRTYSPSLDSRGRSYETLQWVSYGVGTGLVALGGVFYFLGQRAGTDTERTSIALVPGLGNGNGSVALQGRF